MNSCQMTLPELVLIQAGCKSVWELASLSGETCTNLAASIERLDVPIPLHDLNLLLFYLRMLRRNLQKKPRRKS